MEYFNKMNTRFKAATWGFNNSKWSIVIKVAEELGIKPSNYKKMNGHLRREVKSVDEKIQKHKSTFGWRLYQTEEKHAKDQVIKDFIYRLFRRRV
jgi:DNA-directed RNA polymerase sigma subunit (sigma70/sigma32)